MKTKEDKGYVNQRIHFLTGAGFASAGFTAAGFGSAFFSAGFFFPMNFHHDQVMLSNIFGEGG